MRYGPLLKIEFVHQGPENYHRWHWPLPVSSATKYWLKQAEESFPSGSCWTEPAQRFVTSVWLSFGVPRHFIRLPEPIWQRSNCFCIVDQWPVLFDSSSGFLLGEGPRPATFCCALHKLLVVLQIIADPLPCFLFS